MAERTPKLGHLPGYLLYLLALVVPALLGTGLLACTSWALLCAWAMQGGFPASWSRHLAGALMATAGGLCLVFFTAQGLRPLSLVLLSPWMLLIGLRQAAPLRRATHRAPVLWVLLWALLVVGFYRVGPYPTPTDDFLYATRQSPTPDPLDEPAREAAVAVVRAALLGQRLSSELPPALAEEPPGRVFVTLFRRSRRDRIARGSSAEGSLAERLEEAAEAALAGSRPSKAWRQEAEALRIWIDLAGPEQGIRPAAWRRGIARAVSALTGGRPRWDMVVYDAEPGVDGFALTDPETGKEGVVLPADVMIRGWLGPRSRKARYRLDNFEAIWSRLARRAGTEAKPASLPFSNFRTYSFAQPDPAEPRTVELFRGNVLLDAALDEATLLDGIDRMGRWLLGTVEPSGRFDYEYFPARDRHGRGYNEVRHAGSVYGLFHMANLARVEPGLDGSNAYLEAGLLALDRVYRNLGSPPGVDPSEGLVTFLEGEQAEKSNSGSPSLTLLAFLERPAVEDIDDPELKARAWRAGDDAIMAGLAKTLVQMIDEDGKVYALWSEALRGGGVDREPLYYPGEAMLALARYHERTGEARWLDAAKLIGRRQIAHARKPWIVPDHWVMQGLDRLDALDPGTSEWRDGAYAMGRRYLREQFAGVEGDAPEPARGVGITLPDPPFPDYHGAYRRVQEVPRTTRAAARGEALGAVARIAWRRGDPAAHWEQSLLDGGRHLLEQMYTPDNSFYFADPAEGLGALRMGIVDGHCRIDNNQHGVVGLGNALDAIRHRGDTP